MEHSKDNDAIPMVAFEYDALGRRIEKVDAIAGTTTRYYYDDQRVAVETLVSGSVETDDRYFVFGNYIDETLVMHVIPAQAGTQDLYYAHDHLYSPVALFAANGTVAERYEYDAYGSVQILTSNFSPLTSSQHGNPYYFTGRELDTLDAGNCTLMHYRARSYDPETGRFMQRDPLGINPSDNMEETFNPRNQYNDAMSLYQYVLSSPINYLDYDGKCIKSKGDPWLERDPKKQYSVDISKRWDPFRITTFLEIDWQVRTRVRVDIIIVGPSKPPIAPGLPGEVDSGPIGSFEYYDWKWPSDLTFAARDKDYSGNPCRIWVKCKGKCCGRDEPVEWWPMTPVKHSLLGLEWISDQRNFVYGTLRRGEESSITLPGLWYRCEPNAPWEAYEKALCDKEEHNSRCGCVKAK